MSTRWTEPGPDGGDESEESLEMEIASSTSMSSALELKSDDEGSVDGEYRLGVRLGMSLETSELQGSEGGGLGEGGA